MKWDLVSKLHRRLSDLSCEALAKQDGTAKRVESKVTVTAKIRIWRDKEQRWEDGPEVTSEA